jgi:hypothetical protein
VELLSNVLKTRHSAEAFPVRDEAGTHGGTIRAADRADRLFLMTNMEAFSPRDGPRFEGFESGLAGWENKHGPTGYTLGHLRGRSLTSPISADWAAREREAIHSSYAAAIDGNNSTFWISSERKDTLSLSLLTPPMMDTDHLHVSCRLSTGH